MRRTNAPEPGTHPHYLLLFLSGTLLNLVALLDQAAADDPNEWHALQAPTATASVTKFYDLLYEGVVMLCDLCVSDVLSEPWHRFVSGILAEWEATFAWNNVYIWVSTAIICTKRIHDGGGDAEAMTCIRVWRCRICVNSFRK